MRRVLNHVCDDYGVARVGKRGSAHRQNKPHVITPGRPRPFNSLLELGAVIELCRVVPLNPDHHAAELYAANSGDYEGRMWSYLAHGPFSSYEDYLAVMNGSSLKEDRHIYTIIDLHFVGRR